MATTVYSSIGSATGIAGNVNITAVTGSGPTYTVTVDSVTNYHLGCALTDEHATPRTYTVIGISGNDLTVYDALANGTPDNSGTSTATLGARRYSGMASWEAGAPANLVTSDVVWEGQCWNDSEFTQGTWTHVALQGSTSDPTRFKHLTVAAGESWIDSVGDDIPAYNVSNGVGLRKTGNYESMIQSNENFCRVSRFQFKFTGNGSYVVAQLQNGAGASIQIYNTLTEASPSGGTFAILGHAGSPSAGGTSRIYNNAVIIGNSWGAANGVFLVEVTPVEFYGNTCVRTTDQSAGGTAYKANFAAVDMHYANNASFGFTTPISLNGGTPTGDKNATDAASSSFPGSNNKHSVTFSSTTPFQSAAMASLDLRAKAGTDLDGNGLYDSDYPNDLLGTARDVSTPTIGAYELTAAAPPSVLWQPRTLYPHFRRSVR